MTQQNPRDGRSPCACGSGLRADLCCALDTKPTQSRPAARSGPRTRAGGVGREKRREAELLLVDLLERSPLDVGALALLADIRAAQNKRSASEALLKRVVRLDPNHLTATHALARLLFERRALAEAEQHTRNAIRIAPLDPSRTT